MANPFLPLDTYIADGEPHVFGDRVYLFDSRTGHQTKLLIFFDDALKIRSFFITLFASTTIVPHF